MTATSVADKTKSSTSTVTVTPVATLAITTTGLSNALAGVKYSQTFKATGGIPPVYLEHYLGRTSHRNQHSLRRLVYRNHDRNRIVYV